MSYSFILVVLLLAALAESVFIVRLKRRLHNAEQNAEIRLQESKQREIELRREIDRFGAEKEAVGRKDL